MAEPTVDILMATYNGERFVGEQIESILAQNYGNWRLLVSDDCSTDGTLDVVRRYAAADDRIRLVSTGAKHGGAKENFFALMSLSDAPYCMFCDQDDVWLPEKVEKSIAALRALENQHETITPLLVFCDMKVVDEELNVLHESFERVSHYDSEHLEFERLVAVNVAAGCCQCFNAALRDRSLDCDDVKTVEMHDWWTILVAAAFGSVGYVGQQLSLYRQHGSNAVGANEFSPISRARQLDFMVEEFKGVVKQASTFKRVYEMQLEDAVIARLTLLESTLDENSFSGSLRKLLASKCYKRGLRLLGNVVVILRISRSNL